MRVRSGAGVAGGSVGDNRVYVAGGSGPPGSNALTTLEVYTVTTDSWTTKTTVPSAAYSTAFGRLGGSLHMVGGRASPGVTPTALDAHQVYSPTTDTWRTVNSIPSLRYSTGVETDGSTRLYAIGGSDPAKAPDYYWDVELYIATSDTWESRNQMPTGRKFLSVSYYSGYIYASGGFTTTTIATVEAYSLVADSWISLAGLPTARHKLGSTTTQGSLYAFGGIVPSSFAPFVEKYTSTLSTLSPTQLPTAMPTYAFALRFPGAKCTDC